jgi:hypothetical protein
VKATSFAPLRDLIVVEAKVWGPLDHADLYLALDTGSAHTVIVPDIMDDLGFNPRDGAVITGVYSAVGKEQGYLIKVPQFSALGFTRTDFPDPRLRSRREVRNSRSHRPQLPAPVQLYGALDRGTDPRRGDRHLRTAAALR